MTGYQSNRPVTSQTVRFPNAPDDLNLHWDLTDFYRFPVKPVRFTGTGVLRFGVSGWGKKPWLLPSQLASHLSREPPRTLAELYTKMEKYARSDADHRRRVEQRKLMRQQQGWPQGNQSIPRHNPQYIFPVEPLQRAAPHHDVEPYMTPPASQTFNSQPSNHRHDSHRR